MTYKRILTIQDISCVGQCSMTVALPILSACGHETCILPTALLSTHTGGFGKPVVTHLDDAAKMMWHHWQENGITFDAILVGYLGSIAAIETAEEIAGTLLAPGGVLIVDPAMADHGRLYSGFDAAYAQAMGGLCRKADILLPNITEAAMLAGVEYRENMDEDYVNSVLSALGHQCVLLTGAAFAKQESGIALWTENHMEHYSHARVGKSYHGTGDIFAACFTGAFLQGMPLMDAAKLAADFTYRCILGTYQNPAHWYGVKFETALPWLIGQLHDKPAE